MKKILTHLLAFLIGFFMNASSILDNISKIPSSYKEFKRVYFYSGEHLTGKWSNDTEYLLAAGTLGLPDESEIVIMQLAANEHDEITGEILSESICEALPLTWVISAESPEPRSFNFFSKRNLHIKQLKNNNMETVATMKIDSLDERKGVITLKKTHDPLNILPEKLILAKNLPKFEENFHEISEFCAGSPKRHRDKLKANKDSAAE